MKLKKKHMLKISAVYLIGNPKSVKCPASISENPVPLFHPIVVRYPSAEKEPIMEIGFRLETRTKLLFNKLKVPSTRFPYSVVIRGGNSENF